MSAREPSRRPFSARDVRDALVGTLPTAAALLVASWLLDGLVLDPWWTAVVVAVALAAVDAALRPVLRRSADRLGVGAVILLGAAVQVGVIMAVIAVVPGASIAGVGTTLVTLLVVALTALVVQWLLGIDDSAYLVADVVRRGRARRRRAGPAGEGAEGLLVVQIDGLPYGLLRHGIASGELRTLSRWVRSGSHEATTWWARVPSTTPASQAALLHGTNDGIPAFRWYDKDLDRLVVANRPEDAALIESRLSDGHGLLAPDGVSICTMFTGDAATALMVMSRAGKRGGLGPGGEYVRFFARPFVFVRSFVLTLGEMAKEVHQARRQRMREIQPAVSRRGAYVALRGLTNVMLRDLNLALVAEHMVRGAPVIFVDFVDYDEVAHHAGSTRREAVDALAGIDRVLSTLEEVARVAPRRYRFVVLSDHGQSQGPTFRQVAGRTLEEVVRELLDVTASTLDETEDVESWGPVNALLADVLGATASTSRWAGRRSARAGMLVGPLGGRPDEDEKPEGRRRTVTLPGEPPAGRGGPEDTALAHPVGEPERAPESDAVVAGSGNLGLVFFPRLPGRVTVETISERFPALVPGLLREKGVGFVVVDSARGPLAVGPLGVHALVDGSVEGTDPLAPFGPRAARDLARVAAMPTCPDLLVHSSLDARTGEVHAFEELVGSHGGLGGEQNHAVLVHPSDWHLAPDLLDTSVPGEELLYGADAVHRQLVRWMEDAGIRARGGGRPG